MRPYISHMLHYGASLRVDIGFHTGMILGGLKKAPEVL